MTCFRQNSAETDFPTKKRTPHSAGVQSGAATRTDARVPNRRRRAARRRPIASVCFLIKTVRPSPSSSASVFLAEGNFLSCAAGKFLRGKMRSLTVLSPSNPKPVSRAQNDQERPRNLGENDYATLSETASLATYHSALGRGRQQEWLKWILCRNGQTLGV